MGGPGPGRQASGAGPVGRMGCILPASSYSDPRAPRTPSAACTPRRRVGAEARRLHTPAPRAAGVKCTAGSNAWPSRVGRLRLGAARRDWPRCLGLPEACLSFRFPPQAEPPQLCGPDCRRRQRHQARGPVDECSPASRLARCSPCEWHAGSPYAALQPLFPSRYDGATGAACCPTVSDPAVLIPPSQTSRKRDGACNEQEARGGACGGAQSPWQARLRQGVTTRISSALTCVHCCLVLACLSLLWTRRRALPFVHESCRCKPSCLSEVRASRWSPAGSLAPGGRNGGVRRASLLLLVPWLAVCTAGHTAGGTICSTEPTVCDGTYSGAGLCALPTTLSPRYTARPRG